MYKRVLFNKYVSNAYALLYLVGIQQWGKKWAEVLTLTKYVV
jgi:hypothetical protein